MYCCCWLGLATVVPPVKKKTTLKLVPVHHHFLILSCSYALNPAPVRFANINPAKSGSGRICKNQIRYSPTLQDLINRQTLHYVGQLEPTVGGQCRLRNRSRGHHWLASRRQPRLTRRRHLPSWQNRRQRSSRKEKPSRWTFRSRCLNASRGN